ncbi:MAG: AbrB/MazE/SpoVT family DNA-binding domain-containing protein [Ruthenibacterium sp.]
MEIIVQKKINDTGRVIIPHELRKLCNLYTNTSVELIPLPEQQAILVRKKTNACDVCGQQQNLMTVGGICLCTNCIRGMIPVEVENANE